MARVEISLRADRRPAASRPDGALRLRPYQPGDEDAFEPRADFAADRAATAWNWAKGAPGPTWTLLHGRQVLGIGGAVQGENHAWQAWAQLAELERRDWPQAVRLAGVVLTHLTDSLGAHWIWAEARQANAGAGRALEHLGFEPFDIERRASLGVDVVRYLRRG